MLLPLGVKILWFVLSLTGLLGCWVVLLGLGRSVNSLWVSVLYCAGCTMLQGIVCLGMVWKMDPLAMPGRFCTAQSVLIALGSFVMAGIISLSSYMTHKIVLKPKTWVDSSHEPLNWRPAYALPTVLFPLAALAVHVALIVKLKSVIPAVEFYCDASSPQWVRFLSYAGTPLLLYIPSLVLSTKSILSIQETQRHIQRARSSELDPDSFPGTPPPSPSYSTDCYTNSFKRRARGWSQSLREQRKLKEKQSIDNMDTKAALARDTPTKSFNDASSASSLRFSMSAFPSRTSKGTRAPTPLSQHATAVHFQLPAKPPLRVPISTRTSNATGTDLGHQDRGESSSSPEPSLSSSGLSSPTATLHVVGKAYSVLSSFPESSNDTIQIAEIGRGVSPSGSFITDTSSRNRPNVHPRELEGEDRGDRSTHDDDSDIKSIRSQDRSGVRDDRDSSGEFELGEIKTSEGHDSDGDGEGDEHTLSDEMGTVRVLPQMRTHMKQFNNDPLYGLPPLFRTARRPTRPSLPSEIWRLILFQITFVIVQILGSLSTIVDVARRHPVPSPLGTHHFSLLFAAWGPVMFFGCLQSVRLNILPKFLQRTPRVDSSS